MKNQFLFLFLFAMSLSCDANNKIINLISTPRSLSVAFLRMMQQRKDFNIFNEPSQCAFNSITWPNLASQVYLEDAPKTYKEVKKRIFDASLKSPVFAKEMAFTVLDFIGNDDELLVNPNIYFAFLLRNPHAVLISYCKRAIEMPNDLSDRIGCKSMYELFKIVKQKSKNPPLLILSEQLHSDPYTTVGKFCQHVNIDFDPNALKWEDLGTHFTGTAWNEDKKPEFVQRWHGDAIRSTCFNRPQLYEIDANGQPTFSEIKNDETRKACINAYKTNMPYYKLLIEETNNV